MRLPNIHIHENLVSTNMSMPIQQKGSHHPTEEIVNLIGHTWILCSGNGSPNFLRHKHISVEMTNMDLLYE